MISARTPDTWHLVFYVPLYCWLKHKDFPTNTGTREFHVMRWMDKTWQEAESWALVASNFPRWCYFFIFFYLIANNFNGSTGSKKVITPSGEVRLWVLSLGSQKAPSCAMCFLCRLFTLWYQLKSIKPWEFFGGECWLPVDWFNWATSLKINTTTVKIYFITAKLIMCCDDVATICSPSSGTSVRLQNRVSVPSWFLHSDCM